MKRYKTHSTYIGNLLIVKDGIGTVSNEKYVVVRKGLKFYTKPNNIRVYVGNYVITKYCEGYKFLINAKKVSDVVEGRYINDDDINLLLLSKNR